LISIGLGLSSSSSLVEIVAMKPITPAKISPTPMPPPSAALCLHITGGAPGAWVMSQSAPLWTKLSTTTPLTARPPSTISEIVRFLALWGKHPGSVNVPASIRATALLIGGHPTKRPFTV
jgi:hypothetical protein